MVEDELQTKRHELRQCKQVALHNHAHVREILKEYSHAHELKGV